MCVCVCNEFGLNSVYSTQTGENVSDKMKYNLELGIIIALLVVIGWCLELNREPSPCDNIYEPHSHMRCVQLERKKSKER